MTTIPLNRQFSEWHEDDSERAFRRGWMGAEGLLEWPALLKRRRVVVLAEAGSGKTEELREQARLQSATGKAAFYATVQDVGRDGLDKALRRGDRTRLATWRANSDQGWFFIDSIDEAKLERISLERALRQLADGIAGAEDRAHIVLSGRHTDWEFARDARRYNEELPLPQPPAGPAPSLETQIRRALRYEDRPNPVPVESPLVVVMEPLDEDRVRAYGAGKGVPNLDELMSAIGSANLWDFACRPLDLDWIVRFWLSHRRLGSLTEMIDASLRERVRESDPERDRRGSLDVERGMRGLERVGAAMVLGRHSTIAIPDKEATPTDASTSITLDAILPDWSSEERFQLLTRPAFDPATFGCARLHNDNEGVVRAYLAARWLLRLGRANLPQARLLNLLFSRTYEIDLIKPSMLETAAWLSLWDERVRREVVRRAPFLPLTAGDPAGLPPEVRSAALVALVDHMRRGDEIPLLDQRSVARFAKPDLAPTLRAIWTADREHEGVRTFVLRLIWLGAIKECADLAVAASFGKYKDRYTQLVSGRAVVATGDDETHAAYADYIMKDCASVHTSTVFEAIEDLFPKLIDVEGLLAVLTAVHSRALFDENVDLDWKGAKLVDRLSRPADLSRLIVGLLRLTDDEQRETSFERGLKYEGYAVALAAATARLLDCSPPDVAPDETIDAILRLRDDRFGRAEGRRKNVADAVERLLQTPARRRATFWRSASKFSGTMEGRPLLHLFQMQYLGWPFGLTADDICWLLEDAPERKISSEKRLGTNATLYLWEELGRPEALKLRIASVAAKDDEMQAAFVDWMTPRAKSAEEIESERQYEEVSRTADARRADDVKSWVEFIGEVRTNPDLLRNPAPTTETTIDTRIFKLWALLDRAVDSDDRGNGSLTPIIEIAGREVAEAFADGLAQVWRAWKPTMKCERKPGERNMIYPGDRLGVAAVAIEAVRLRTWSVRLTPEEAKRAAEYATLEIGSFPAWLASLAASWPNEVEEVLAREAATELDLPEAGGWYRTLDQLDRASQEVITVMTPAVWRELQIRTNLSARALEPMLGILRRGLPQTRKASLYSLALDRFQSSDDPEVVALYIGTAFAVDDQGAMDALEARVEQVDASTQKAFVERALPEIFGSCLRPRANAGTAVDPRTLERLVLLAFRTVRVEDDHERANKGVYSPDARDAAQEARSAAFSMLVTQPGQAAFGAIQRLIDVPGFPVPSSRLRALALERAGTDAEHTAWKADDPFRFEQQFERPPVTGQELQLVVLQRLQELQHELIHGDFQQGVVLSALPKESDVQAWIADRMRLVQGAAYSIEREVEVAAMKNPDLRFRAKASDANVAIEIKVAESWTLEQLEDALVTQLCEQYLRAQDSRDGVLLLVHQKPRPKGWELPDGAYLSFDGLVQRLQEQATNICRQTPTGPRPAVAVLDVSKCAKSDENKKPAKRRYAGRRSRSDKGV